MTLLSSQKIPPWLLFGLSFILRILVSASTSFSELAVTEVTPYDLISTSCQLGFSSFIGETAATVLIMGTNLTEEHSQFWRKFFSQFWGNFPNDGLANERPTGPRPSISFEKDCIY